MESDKGGPRRTWVVPDRPAAIPLPADSSSRGRSVARQLAVLDAVRHEGVLAEARLAVGLIALEVALEPGDLAVALEREDVRRDAIEEPPIVADHDGAARERQQRVLEV